MPLHRHHLLGAPHTYLVQAQAARSAPIFATGCGSLPAGKDAEGAGEADRFLVWLERVRRAFEARIFAYRITVSAFQCLIRHDAACQGSDDRLRGRWAQIAASTGMPTSRLRSRFASLGGFMQTVMQRYSRDWNRRHGTRGHLWAGRFRSCLLADDAALLAAVVWLEDEEVHDEPTLVSSRARHQAAAGPLTLAPLPLRVGPGGQWFTHDESPPGLSPLQEADGQIWLEHIASDLSRSDRRAYGAALTAGWALGRPESLSESLARLGRRGGRGRSRQLRDLDDHLGLCGVWG